MSIKAPYTHKLMVVGMLIHYAAALNALGTNVAALLIGDQFLAKIKSEAGNLTFLLSLLLVTALTWPLVWRFSTASCEKA